MIFIVIKKTGIVTKTFDRCSNLCYKLLEICYFVTIIEFWYKMGIVIILRIKAFSMSFSEEYGDVFLFAK